MDEYRSVQELVRGGQYQEALERARAALVFGRLGRRYAARLNSLVCWLYVSGLQEPSPAAVLHGEEAVRLADLCNDEWIRCEALGRLIPAYCHLGDVDRAEQGCEALARELERNEVVIAGGWASLWLLRALAAMAAGDLERADHCISRAQEAAGPGLPEMVERIRQHREVVEALGEPDRTGAVEARRRARTLCLEGDGELALAVRAVAMEALLAEQHDALVAQEHAREALHRAIAIGRADLARLVRRRLAHLLEG
jgi:tetratricopeptide (TPR) repeat protein